MNIKGYTKLNIGGKSRSFKFGTNATAIYCEKQDITLKEFITVFTKEKIDNVDFSPALIRDLIWSGLVAGAHTDKTEVDFNELDVGDWIDEMEQVELEKAMRTIAESNKTTGKKKVKEEASAA